ncbi:MAG: hypothetical protein ABI763_07975 [Bacteroidota bacterium]
MQRNFIKTGNPIASTCKSEAKQSMKGCRTKKIEKWPSKDEATGVDVTHH